MVKSLVLGSFSTCFLILATMNASVEAFKEFTVGNDSGWGQPSANNTTLYSEWATRKRFHVGDSLFFEYQNDSVLVVDKWGYYHCSTDRPIASFNDGRTEIILERPGPFYFISGSPNHCKNGQRLLVQVMGLHHSSHSPPFIAAPPEHGMALAPHPNSGIIPTLTLSSVFLSLIVTSFTLVWCAP